MFSDLANTSKPPVKIHPTGTADLFGNRFRQLMLASLVVCLSGFTQPAVAASLSIAVSRSPLSLPLYIAQDKGFFRAEGVEVKFRDCFGGHRCLQQVLEGHTDMATAGDIPIALSSFQHTDVVVIGTMVTTSDNVKIITNLSAEIDSPAKLKGMRVGATIGSESHYFLELSLLTAGIDPHDLTVVGLQQEDMLGALRSGKVDAVAAWEPYAYEVTHGMGTTARALPGISGYVQSFNLVCHRTTAGIADDTLVRLLRAVEQAELFIKAHPTEAKAILRQRLQLDPVFIDHLWESMAFRLGLDQSLISTLEGEARWARRGGHVKRSLHPNILNLVHTAPLKAVMAGAVGIAN